MLIVHTTSQIQAGPLGIDVLLETLILQKGQYNCVLEHYITTNFNGLHIHFFKARQKYFLILEFSFKLFPYILWQK